MEMLGKENAFPQEWARDHYVQIGASLRGKLPHRADPEMGHPSLGLVSYLHPLSPSWPDAPQMITSMIPQTCSPSCLRQFKGDDLWHLPNTGVIIVSGLQEAFHNVSSFCAPVKMQVTGKGR